MKNNKEYEIRIVSKVCLCAHCDIQTQHRQKAGYFPWKLWKRTFNSKHPETRVTRLSHRPWDLKVCLFPVKCFPAPRPLPKPMKLHVWNHPPAEWQVENYSGGGIQLVTFKIMIHYLKTLLLCQHEYVHWN